MKRFKFKKLIALVIGATIVVPAIGVKAVDKSRQEKKYVALGDSISYGMSAEQGKGYVDLFYNKLRLADKDMVLKNLSVPGATSSDLLKTIEENKQAIEGAEVVTISIGGNNFLKPTIVAVARALGVDPDSMDLKNELKLKVSGDPKGAMEKLMVINKDETYLAELEDGGDRLVEDFPIIIDSVKKLAPKAKIYVNNLYNPLPQGSPLYEVYKEMCTNMNTQLLMFKAERYEIPYKVVDTYSLFKERPDYINFLTEGFDPHPSSAGHAVLLEKLIDVVGSDIKNVNELSKKSDDEIYKMAYEATTKALGSKTQKNVNEARRIIINIPDKLKWAKEEFSTQLDQVQNVIMESVMVSLDKAWSTKSKSDRERAEVILADLMTVEYNDYVKLWSEVILAQWAQVKF